MESFIFLVDVVCWQKCVPLAMSAWPPETPPENNHSVLSHSCCPLPWGLWEYCLPQTEESTSWKDLQAWFWPNPEWKLALARISQGTLPCDDAEPKDPQSEPGPLIQHQLCQTWVCHSHPGVLASSTRHVSVSCCHHLLFVLQVPGFKSIKCTLWCLKGKQTTEEVSIPFHKGKTKGQQRKHPFVPPTEESNSEYFANYWRDKWISDRRVNKSEGPELHKSWTLDILGWQASEFCVRTSYRGASYRLTLDEVSLPKLPSSIWITT